MAVELALFAGGDIDAIEIGTIYRRANRSAIDAVRDWWQCGQRLIHKKASDPTLSRRWLLWLADNEQSLGFGEGVARRLMQFARENRQLTGEISAEDAKCLLGDLWWNSRGRHDNLLGNYEWYTPAEIIEAARVVLGEIDLDPASCGFANQIVRAKTFYSKADSDGTGLEKAWFGRVFINPPFAHPQVRDFADKLADHFSTGEVTEAIWLSNATVDTDWWQRLARLARSVCFHSSRIKFYSQGDSIQPPTLGQCILYFGGNAERFRENFSVFGVILACER
jgi:hypothetical protein